ncbi:MAG: hypothetical protein KJ070_13130 [Verrucomicrobia bacterium]|nr:hypothetical protein [Verrucomicrobiota bacterium]
MSGGDDSTVCSTDSRATSQTKRWQVSIRFSVAGLFLFPLVYVMKQLSRWRSIEREVYLTLLEGALAAVVVVLLFSVLKRGDQWQRVLAAALLVIPAFGLLDALLRALGSVFGFSF